MVIRIAEVAVNAPLLRNFHYSVPEALVEQIELGHRVLIPFGRRTTTGVCVAFPAESEVPGLKPIERLLHPECRFDDHLLRLTRWMAAYYHTSWGEVLEAALPPPIRAVKKEPLVRWLERSRTREDLLAEASRISTRSPQRAKALAFLAERDSPMPRADFLREAGTTPAVLRRILAEGWAMETKRKAPAASPPLDSLSPDASTEDGTGLLPDNLLELQLDQVKALDVVGAALSSNSFQAILVQGITGSGKTEVYLRALRQVLDAGRRGLVLVPEISLTPQTVSRFQSFFPNETISVLHSMLTSKARGDQWRDIQQGKAKLVIGARSSIFAPIEDLGLIVVDEEHDSSYKQESSPRYNARDVAIMRASMLKIPVLLGSATPTLESAWNARSGKYHHVTLARRATSHGLPTVTTVPLDGAFYRPNGSGLITDRLDYHIRKRLQTGDQVMLFLNRRGFATFLHCVRCGFVLNCNECDVSLTFHRNDGTARCHYCGHARAVPADCSDCGMPGLRRSGVGTEKITARLKERYPEARVLQLDRDTVTTYQALQDGLDQFARREHDILVGTQMIAKGHDFPHVTLVGIINADTGLHFPDFRAAERTFQLVTQVAGRAGRGTRSGHVVLQTFFPEHYAIEYAARAEFDGFLEKELANRKPLGYPPFGRLVKIQLQGKELESVREDAERVARTLREEARRPGQERCQVLGPAPSPLARVQGKYRYQILVKSKSSQSLHHLLDHLDRNGPKPRRGTERAIDVDPQSML